MTIPISAVNLGPEVEHEVLEVIRSGNLAQGKKVAEFEQMFSELAGVKHAIAVNNGTTSLVASIQILDLQPGDEVLTSPFTFVASLNAILEAGATATFADINYSDFNLNAEDVGNRINQNTKVIMPVHLYGQMAEMDKLTQIASANKLRVLEDAAQAHGAKANGESAGSFDLGSFSFYATKNITTGEGGIITTNNDDDADRLRVLRNQGMRARYQYEVAGHNYRMTDLQAAIAIPQLKTYETNVIKRSENASVYQQNFEGIKGLITPKVAPGRNHVWHQYTLRITEDAKISREELADKLSELGIGHGFYYPKLVFDYETYKSNPRVKIDEFPNAKKIVEEVISIPVHPNLSKDDVLKVSDTITKLLG